MRLLVACFLITIVSCQPKNNSESTAEGSLTTDSSALPTSQIDIDTATTVPPVTNYPKWEATNYLLDVATPKSAYGIIAAGKTLYSDTLYTSALITQSPDVVYLLSKEEGSHTVSDDGCLQGSWQRVLLDFGKETAWVDIVEVIVDLSKSPEQKVTVDDNTFLMFTGTQSGKVTSDENGCPDYVTPYFYNAERNMVSLVEVPEGFQFPEVNIFAQSYNGWLAFRSTSLYGGVKFERLSANGSQLTISLKVIYAEGGEVTARIYVTHDLGTLVLQSVEVDEWP